MTWTNNSIKAIDESIVKRVRENLSLGKPAWQKSNYPGARTWGADKAVDGNYTYRGALGNQCTISADYQQTAEWRVDLESVVSISHINIFYRTDNRPSPSGYESRFAGFFLYISNTTSKDDGFLCFHEIQNVSGTPIEDQRINCSLNGRYVIYYNERRPDVVYPDYYSTYAFNELCELEVYGCHIPGYYGEFCNQTCPVNCQRQQCDVVNGDCVNGCLPGYIGLKCGDKCGGGTYGVNCTQSCGHCLNNEQCHHINGTCLQGCSPGYKGPGCKAKCDSGMYGINCNQVCGHCINYEQCHHINGSCLQGCSQGYKGSLCNSACDDGLYGENCNQSCGHCINNIQCNHVNGLCYEGCSVGFKGLLCDNACDGGMYGVNCNRVCGHCLNNEQCHHINGTCLQGCSKGYRRTLCKIACEVGKYGYNCNESCRHCMHNTTCNHVNGTCQEGCSVGYHGPLCTNVCSRSHWGVNCKETCSTECVSQTCHHESGHCLLNAQAQFSNTCKNDYTITITSVVVCILIVLMSSLLNFVIWRKMQQKGAVLDTPNDKDYYNEFPSVRIGDKQSGQDMNISPYAELTELDHTNTYEQIHRHVKADEKM
ncbi:multiple epidermal growth factor-like domains protein 10 [Saccostrea cucullata]|uniref:multiple epidermal growth factor-like domains protein 10 n=1 Tax=Saccostrea cuccullata TaxID=36930 RepID=UPI002ED4143B